MANLQLHIRDEQIIEKLTSIAKLQNRTVEEMLDFVLHDWIEDYEDYMRNNPILQMIASADELGAIADRDDISEHFDELLREMIANDEDYGY